MARTTIRSDASAHARERLIDQVVGLGRLLGDGSHRAIQDLRSRRATAATATPLPQGTTDAATRSFQLRNTLLELDEGVPESDRGIGHVYVEPATPRLNGKVERSHRIDQEEFYGWSKGS